MLQKYGDQIAPLERTASSQWIGLPLLVIAVCGGLWTGAVVSGSLPVAAVILLGIVPGSILSLWQLQLLHDVLQSQVGRQNPYSIENGKSLMNAQRYSLP